uniref:DDE Tnp4 domain-containing protein n=1 Tax=Strigamia maritima TaxID=126957 RepID=T1IK39_STRMM
MNRDQFSRILSLIQDHDIFQNFSNNSYPVSVQLLIALSRFGSFGNSASVMAIARNFGVGDGGTLNIFTKRVIIALLSLETKYIFWPNEAERKSISRHMHAQLLPQCIGFVDGTHIALASAPKDDAISYFNRKSFYSLNVQIIADPFKRIRSYHIGQPGKVHDAGVFADMDMATQPNIFFSDDQYIIGDAAYKLTTTLITPYRQRAGLTRNHEKFNHHLSKKRIAIEHVNGILKARFASLRGLRMVVNREGGHQFACEWVVACMILYNYLLSDDPWDENTDESNTSIQIQDDDDDEYPDNDDLNGKTKRDELMDYIIPQL